MNSKPIQTQYELHSLIDMYIGIHAARIGKPYLSLLSKGVNEHISLVYNKINLNRSFVTLRCVRTTLHICNLKNSKIMHHSTKSIRITSKMRLYSQLILQEYECFLKELFMTTPHLKQNEIELGFETKYKMDKSESKLLVKYFWEYGLICLLNQSQSCFKEIRVFALFETIYGFDISVPEKSEQEYINDLIYKYVLCFGPVSKKDIIWWTGLSNRKISLAIENIKKHLYTIYGNFSNIEMYVFKQSLDGLLDIKNNQTWCKFLSYEDSALKGYYETRCLYATNPELYFNKIGEVFATIIINGECIGKWSLDIKRQRLLIDLYKYLNKEEMFCINEEKRRMQKLIFEKPAPS